MRYYWLKFKEDFFDSKRIKKLRNMAGGDTYCIIYLKMQLKALKTGGVLEFTGVEEQFADELALDLDERPDDVRVTLLFLLQYGLCECSDNVHYFLPWVEENTGSENASAQRVREFRAKQKALHCNASETQVKRIGNAEKEKEIEIDISSKEDMKRKRFVPPTIEDIKSYMNEKGYTKTNPEAFIAHYDSVGWKVGKNPMKNWHSALTGWELRETDRTKKNAALKYEQKPISNKDFDALVVDLGDV